MLDRALQLHIMKRLSACYPEGLYSLTQAMAAHGASAQAVKVNAQYLDGHGLIVSGFRRRGALSDNAFYDTHEHQITPKGLDFLADDGGLGAMLGVVTVRIDAAQWAELLASKVEALDGVNPAERSQVADALRKLPAQAVEKVSGKLLDWAVDHAQDAWPLLRMWLSQAAA
jgi:hypothetical protein